jgi:peroxiredoxin
MGTKVVIKGQLEGPKQPFVYLEELTISGHKAADSIAPDKSGFFKFKREVKYPSFFTLRTKQRNNFITLLAMPGERIKITGRADSLMQTYQVTGSDGSKDVQLLTQRLAKTIRARDSLNRVYKQFYNSPNIENIRQILTMNYQNCLEGQRQFTISFITKKPSSLACLMALYQKLDSNSWVLYKAEDIKYYIKVDSALFKKYKDAPHVMALHTNIQQLKEQDRVLQLQQMLANLGAKAPDIALPSSKGDTIRLSSLKGKVILLDFWASWNSECRKDNKNLVLLYNKYKSKGFEIFQVSLDKTKETWVKAIKEDRLWWAQVSDLKYWQSPVVQLYNFKKIPTTYLIDKDGIIIARDLKGEALSNKLAEIFEQKSITTGKQITDSGK